MNESESINAHEDIEPKLCQWCKEPMNDDAIVCSHCGKQESHMSMSVAIAIAIIVPIICVALISICAFFG